MYLDTAPFALECNQCLTMSSVRQRILIPTQATEAKPGKEKKNNQMKNSWQIEETSQRKLWTTMILVLDTYPHKQTIQSAYPLYLHT